MKVESEIMVSPKVEASGPLVLCPPYRASKRAQGSFRATVAGLNDDGWGVARVDGKVTFIEGALPGEDVTFLLEKRRKNYDRGWAFEVHSISPDRVTPACRYFGLCGGCSLQHLDSAAQIREKEQVLRDKLRQFGKLAPASWLTPVTGPAWGYRRSARLGVRYVEKKGGILVGFREQRSSYITPLRGCEVLDPRAAVLLPDLYDLLPTLSCFTRIPQIEVVCGDDTVALVFRHLERFTAEDLARMVEFARSHEIHVYSQLRGPESIAPIWVPHDVPLTYRLPEYELTFQFKPTNFVQINAEINRRMVHLAVELLDPGAEDHVLDLFCGLGNFTLPLARYAGRVTGVDADASLVAVGRANARLNAITNAEFRQADLYDADQAAIFWNGFRCDRLLLDPPRSGALDVIKTMPGPAKPGRIVYVSCNPATLARDAEYLVNVLGYSLASIGVMDMFPQTNHVESIAVFDGG